MRDEDVIEAARAIRPRLASLIGEDATLVGARLDAIMSSADPIPKMADAIVSVVVASAPLRAEFLKLFPEEADIVRSAGSAGYAGGPPGLSAPSATAVYYCPKCDYRFPVFEVGEPVPPCPNGHGPLKLLPNSS